jgi:hypothetical protein
MGDFPMIRWLLSFVRRRRLEPSLESQQEAMRRALEESVTWIASELVAAGYRADVSLGSLEELDRYIDDNTDNGEPKSGVLLRQKGRCVLALGAYVGEAIRRAQGGQWFLDPDRPNDIFHIQLRLDDGLCMWPMQRVWKRITNGPEDCLAHYGEVAVSMAS